jgi:phytanoyl-CoA hydroxylase
VHKSFDLDQVADRSAKFADDGYLVLSAYFSPTEIDTALAAMDAALRSRGMEIVVDSLLDGERSFYALVRDPESQQFKFNDLYLMTKEVRELALEAGLSELLRALLGGMRPVLCNTLTLIKGSSQALHIDSLFMTPQTPHHLIAAWIALEDVDPTAGPLVYYPGSHKIPLYRFHDGSHHATGEELPDWSNYIHRELDRLALKKETFLASKGDVFLWHSDLVHGGNAIQDANKTRRSLVCHYFTEPDTRKFTEWRLEPLNSGFWLDRLPQAVRLPPERFDAQHPFPENAYLRRHPDLQIALKEGRISSGFEHYRTHGYVEGRAI